MAYQIYCGLMYSMCGFFLCYAYMAHAGLRAVSAQGFKLISMGVGFGVVLVACSAATYRFYRIDIENQMFYGQDKNIPFADCRKKYDSQGKLVDGSPCVMTPREDYVKLKNGYEAIKIELNDCQKHRSK